MCRKIEYIQKILEEKFKDPSPPLDHKDPYTLLIAVLLSAQCTDKRVNLISKSLFLKASTPAEMIKLSLEEIESLIRSLGLYKTKAKAIFNLSRILMDKFDGKVPKSEEELESLPGVGHKTASVILTQIFNIPAFPVDTHIHRLGQRWGLTNGKNVRQTEEDLKKVFRREDWGKIHLQMIYYAREYCPARNHKEGECPICTFCNSTNRCN